MKIKLKHIGLALLLGISMVLINSIIAAALSTALGTITCRESLFIGGFLTAFIFCLIISFRFRQTAVLLNFTSSFIMSTALFITVFLSLNIVESFLIPFSYYSICLFTLVLSLGIRFKFSRGELRKHSDG